jgi:hypothetical protein
MLTATSYSHLSFLCKRNSWNFFFFISMLTIQPISICLLHCSLISYSLLIVLIYNRIFFFVSLAMTTILIQKFQKLNALLLMMDNYTMTFHNLKHSSLRKQWDNFSKTNEDNKIYINILFKDRYSFLN